MSDVPMGSLTASILISYGGNRQDVRVSHVPLGVGYDPECAVRTPVSRNVSAIPTHATAESEETKA